MTEGVANRTYDAAARSQIVQNPISAVAKHFAGNVWAWDVVNEAFKRRRRHAKHGLVRHSGHRLSVKVRRTSSRHFAGRTLLILAQSSFTTTTKQ